MNKSLHLEDVRKCVALMKFTVEVTAEGIWVWWGNGNVCLEEMSSWAPWQRPRGKGEETLPEGSAFVHGFSISGGEGLWGGLTPSHCQGWGCGGQSSGFHGWKQPWGPGRWTVGGLFGVLFLIPSFGDLASLHAKLRGSRGAFSCCPTHLLPTRVTWGEASFFRQVGMLLCKTGWKSRAGWSSAENCSSVLNL